MNRLRHLALCPASLLAAWLFAGCSHTKVTSSWVDPALGAKRYEAIMVVAVDERGDVRRRVEEEFVRQLTERGLRAAVSHDRFALADIKEDKQNAAGAMREAGFDAVLVVRLVDTRTLVRTMPEFRPQLALTPYQFDPAVPYRSWTAYYDTSYAYALDQARERTDEVLVLESNLYEVPGGGLKWTGHTETFVPEGADKPEKLRAFVRTIVANLAENRVIP